MFLVLMKKSELKIYEELRWSGLLGSKHMNATKPDHFFKPAVVLFRDRHLPPIQSNIHKYKKAPYYLEMRYSFSFFKGGSGFQCFVVWGVCLNIF